ncbi:MAG: alpha-glucan family phosphorylase [candidate division KSB1 bacterium]|nr:alpha-glucan family phosphorylase [candidate division KSB1 bacterium]
MDNEKTIAYFSMEIGLEAGMPTYSGGLGVLAGDTIRSAANLKIPLVAVTLLHRKGYFYQKLDASGWQTEEPVAWSVDDFLTELPERTSVTIEGRTVTLRAWKYEVSGYSGFKVPVYFLDADLPENSDWDRTLTHYLYGGDSHYRLCQEVILGIGGVRMLRALGYQNITRFHMNEGHASLLTLELIDEHLKQSNKQSINPDDVEAIRKKCVFTTHTPVPAGHDQFPMELVERVLGQHEAFTIRNLYCCEGVLNMTYLALNLSHYINGVAKKHKEVSSLMFARYVIDSITNGVNAATWTSEPFQELFDRYIPGWREDNFNLRYALSIPREEVWQAHVEAKRKLIQYVNRETNAGMDQDILTLGFARRATTYKRADLIFQDVERLKKISSNVGPLQLIFAGKAHPQDQGGKEIIKRIYQARESLKNDIKIAYLANYDIELGKLITAGVDVWLNTPIPPREASGTSGMKAAMNGVPSLSILDGWWIEGCIEGVTGWAIGQKSQGEGDSDDPAKDAESLYQKLETVVIPMFYHNRELFINIMLNAIALNGSFFNTQRMMQQYVLKAYFL